MSFGLTIAVIATLDIGLLALLTFVMGRPRKLAPHRRFAHLRAQRPLAELRYLQERRPPERRAA